MAKFLMSPEPQTIIQIFILYGLLAMFVYFASDFMIFQPPKSSYKDKPGIIKLKTRDGKKISAYFLENPSSRYTILMSHGNAEDIGSLNTLAEEFYKHGFSILIYDYHGYGTSEGRPSEFNTYLDIDAAYRYLVFDLHIPKERIILYGRSLGSGPTLEFASKVRVAGVILESPFLTAFRIVTAIPLFPIDKYRNNQKVQNINTPLLVIHGSQDKVIPLWQGNRLFEMARLPKRFITIEGAGHNDVYLVGGKAYWQAIDSFANALPYKSQ